MMTDQERFIVAEVSKNWIDGREATPTGLLAQQFEQCINTNLKRGYRLHSFQIHRIIVSEHEWNETLIAVFERESAHSLNR